MQVDAPELIPSVGIVRQTLNITNIIQRANLTPKSFIQTFLASSHIELAYRRRFWTTATGWPSTMEILNSIRDQALGTEVGSDLWRSFILAEVIV